MDTITASSVNQPSRITLGNESAVSAVSWAAVAAGAFVAAALSVTLLALGAGLGLSSVSPWTNAGASAATVGVATIVWLIVMQLVASSMGGYLAGRLRTKWASVHTDEVFFRDTAHGFLVWAVGLVMAASFLASAASSLIGGTAKAGAVAASTAAVGAAGVAATDGADKNVTGERNAYFTDTLLRTERPEGVDAATRTETNRILVQGLKGETFPAADKTYLAKTVAVKTGLSQAESEQRVNEVIAKAKNAEMEARQAADTARKAAAHLSLWMFLGFLIGAFCASYAATIGGRQRDRLAF